MLNTSLGFGLYGVQSPKSCLWNLGIPGHRPDVCQTPVLWILLFWTSLDHLFSPQKWLSAAVFLPGDPDPLPARADSLGVDTCPKLDQSASSSGSLEFSMDRGQRSHSSQGNALLAHQSNGVLGVLFKPSFWFRMSVGVGAEVLCSNTFQVTPVPPVLRPHFEKQGPRWHTLFPNNYFDHILQWVCIYLCINYTNVIVLCVL